MLVLLVSRGSQLGFQGELFGIILQRLGVSLLQACSRVHSGIDFGGSWFLKTSIASDVLQNLSFSPSSKTLRLGFLFESFREAVWLI